MRSLLSFLGIGDDAAARADEAETETVRKIVAKLEALPPDRARHVAAFAYILGRVANADLEISRDETRVMERLVIEHGGLPPEQALLVVEIAKGQNRLFGGTENYLVTREFAGIATPEERERLLECLFAVSTADDSISAEEEHQIRLITEELNLPPETFISLRARFNEKRSVIQRMDQPQRES